MLDRSLLSVSTVGCSSSSMTLSSALERRPGGVSPIMRSMGSESEVTSSLASFKTASWTRQVTAALIGFLEHHFANPLPVQTLLALLSDNCHVFTRFRNCAQRAAIFRG